MTDQCIIRAHTVTKTFRDDTVEVPILSEVNLSIRPGEMTAIIGRSGSGKSTLLHILSGLEPPSSGLVELNGINIHAITESERCKLRNQSLGFVYQFHHLLPEFTALENVAIPLLINNTPLAEIQTQAMTILQAVGLSGREQHYMNQLSGGERQRVAIARALITKPKCVMADEPTGNLDHKTAQQIYKLIFTLREELGIAFLLVTHDLSLADQMDRQYTLSDGHLISST